MSYELFFGLPGHRVIRIAELHAYYRSETDRPRSARAKDATKLPVPLRDFYSSINSRLPNGTSLNLFKTSFSISLDPAHLDVFRASVGSFADMHEILFFDVTGGGWFDAQKPTEKALGFPTYTAERGIMKYIAPGDGDILFAEDWFVDGQFFVVTPRDQQFLQIIRRRDNCLIEFRAGPERPIFRSKPSDAESACALFKGYLAGDNMNTPEYGFEPQPDVLAVEIGLPRRDASGRWFPQAGSSAIVR